MCKKITSLVLTISVLVSCFCGVVVSAEDISMSFDSAYGMVEKMADYLCTQDPSDRDYLYDWVHSYMKTDLGVDSLITLVDDQSSVGDNTTVLNYINSFGTTEADKANLRFMLSLAKSIPTASRAKAFDDMKARNEFALPLTTEETAAIDAVYAAFIDASILDMLNHNEHAITKNVIMQFLADFNNTFVVTDGLNDKNDFELYKLHNDFKTKLENGELKAKYAIVNDVDWQNGEELISTFISSVNSSAKFDDETKQNFKTVWGVEGIDMYVERVFDVNVTGEVNQSAGSTSSITFEAISNIETDDLTKVVWFVDGEEKATGKTFVYDPSVLAEGDSAVIKAVIGAYEKDVTVNVGESEKEYSFTITGSLSQTSTDRKFVTFTAVCNDADEDLSGIKWYVNDIYQDATGSEFKFRPASVGTYVVTAELEDGTILPVGTIKVTASAKPSYSGSSGSSSSSDDETETPSGGSSAEFEKFEDVKNHWSASYMQKLYDKGIMVGTSETTMSPDLGITRQEVAIILVRMFGFESQTATAPLKYTDSDDIADWAKNAVALLSEKGIYLGYGDGSFQPDRIISRQEFASVIGRHISGAEDKTLTYIDADAIYSWAEDHIEELTSLGIIRGFEDASFRPLENVTRAQAAVIIYNTMVSIGAY